MAINASRQSPYEITLTRNRRFVFDHDGEHYRVAWYEKRRSPCPSCEGRGLGYQGRGLCTQCHGHRFLWGMGRTAGKAAELVDAIAAARGEYADEAGEKIISPTLDSALLADYVFSTPWGAELPRAKDWAAMDPQLLASKRQALEYFEARHQELLKEDEK